VSSPHDSGMLAQLPCPKKSQFNCIHSGLLLRFLCFSSVHCSPESANSASQPANGVPIGGAAANNPPTNPNATLGANPPGSGLIGTAEARSSGLPGSAGTMKGDTCAKGLGATSPVTPTVWLIVDGSWRMFDARTVQLTGKACETYLQNSSIVVAKFPCDAFVPRLSSRFARSRRGSGTFTGS
jgi:hypothetical protein